MTQPERQTSAGDQQAWDDVFRCASSEERRRWLDLAGRRGVPPSCEAAFSGNGHKAAETALVSRLFAGELPELEPVIVDATPLRTETALDDSQRRALALALQTPDIALIDGGPGSGKSRVVAETIAAAVQQDQRVLFLAPDAAAIDLVLRQLAGRSHLFAIRLLAADEQADILPGAIRSLTLRERCQDFEREVLDKTRAETERTEARQERRKSHDATWQRMQEVAADYDCDLSRRQELQRRYDETAASIASEVEAIRSAAAAPAGDTFAQTIVALARDTNETTHKAEVHVANARAALQQKAEELEKVSSLHERSGWLSAARQAKRWWTLSWSRALLRGDVSREHARLNEQRTRSSEELHALESLYDKATREEGETKDRCSAAEREVIDAELARRQAELTKEIAVLDAGLARLAEDWQQLCRQLELPSAPAPGAMQQAHQSWLAGIEDDRRRLEELSNWLKSLEQNRATLPDRVLHNANLVAGTMAVLPSMELSTAPGSDTSATFDLLIVDDAHLACDADI